MKKLIMVIISLIMVLGMCFVLGGCTRTKGYGNITIYAPNSYPYTIYHNECNFEITKDYIKIVDKQGNVSYYYNVTFRIVEK